MKIVCISDTHNNTPDVPDGDLLIHSGDATGMGTLEEVCGFLEWFTALPHPEKVFVAGNHDFLLQSDPEAVVMDGLTYLRDSGATIGGLRLWGSPWQPEFHNWAFNLPRCGEELRERWALIPDDIDILITHGPPFGHLDANKAGMRLGCEELAKAVERVKPRLHCFGHIHEGYGITRNEDTIFVNASICTLRMKATNAPIVVDL